MLFRVYQDWGHQNPREQLDGGIKECGRWKGRWENLYVCQPNATTSRQGKFGNPVCGNQRGARNEV